MVEPHSSNFRVITTHYLGVRIFRKVTVYKYYIPKRVIVRNVTLKNMITNRGEAEVDNHIPKVDKAKKKNMCVSGFSSEKTRYGRSAYFFFFFLQKYFIWILHFSLHFP